MCVVCCLLFARSGFSLPDVSLCVVRCLLLVALSSLCDLWWLLLDVWCLLWVCCSLCVIIVSLCVVCCSLCVVGLIVVCVCCLPFDVG